ncbi:MAG: hypothetical protein WB767_17825, partial [Nocardioides sp.]
MKPRLARLARLPRLPRLPRLMVGAMALALLAGGCGGYEATTVPAPAPPAEAEPGPAPTCKNDGRQVRSYQPRGEVDEGAAV